MTHRSAFVARMISIPVVFGILLAIVADASAAEAPASSCERVALIQSAQPGETVLVCETARPARPSKPTIAKINKKQTACQRMPTLCSALR